jgi:hypothetical protein
MPRSVRYVFLQFLSDSAFLYYEKTLAIFSSVTLGMYIIGLKAKQEVLKNFTQHCFIYRPSDSTVSEDAGMWDGIEPGPTTAFRIGSQTLLPHGEISFMS